MHQSRPPASAAVAQSHGSIPAAAWWIGIALFCGFVSLRPLNDPDIWFQLLAGRYVLEHGSVPDHEFFLYTAGADAWQLFGGWAFGLLGELSIRLAGFNGLSIYGALWWAGALVLGVLAIQQSGGERPRLDGRIDMRFAAAASIALLVAYQGFVHRSALRAEVTLVFAWMAATLLFESARDPAARRRALVGFPLICVGLAWFHTTVLLMMPLFAAYALRRLLNMRQEPIPAKEALAWVASGIAGVLLPVLNPNGIPQVVSQVLLWTGVTAQGENAAKANLEYVPLLDPSSYSHWPSAAVLAIGTAVWFVLAGRARWSGLVAITPMIFMALQHRRGIGLWAMALFVPLGCALWEAFRHRLAATRLPAGTLVAGSLVLLGISVLSSVHWGFGLAGASLKDSSTLEQIKRKNPESGNIWAFDGVSPQIPYFLGEPYKIGYAGHMVVRHPAVVSHYADVQNAKPGWEKMLADKKVSTVVVTDMLLPGNELVPVAWQLGLHPHWELLTVDGNYLVYHRRAEGETATAKDRWEQAVAVVQHAVRMTAASQLLAPDETNTRLLTQLQAQLKTLGSLRDNPQAIDWAALERAGRVTAAP
jgi:hypothetical protein